MSTYLQILGGLLEQAHYEYSCFANYSSPAYGTVTDGVPPGVNGTSMKRGLGARSLGHVAESDRFWL